MSTTKSVNNVNVTQLFETIDNIKENTEIAKFNFRTKNKNSILVKRGFTQ